MSSERKGSTTVDSSTSSLARVVSFNRLLCCAPNSFSDTSVHEKGKVVVNVRASLNFDKGDTKPPISISCPRPRLPSVTQHVVRTTCESHVTLLTPQSGGPAFHATMPVGNISSGRTMGMSGSGTNR